MAKKASPKKKSAKKTTKKPVTKKPKKKVTVTKGKVCEFCWKWRKKRKKMTDG